MPDVKIAKNTLLFILQNNELKMKKIKLLNAFLFPDQKIKPFNFYGKSI